MTKPNNEAVERAAHFATKYATQVKFACCECGEYTTLEGFSAEYLAQMQERGCCFSCNFWLNHVARRDERESVRVNGTHFRIVHGDTAFRGFGGRNFTIAFFDGRVVETSNLWHQGAIPQHFRSRLPNNAFFVEGFGR